MEDKVNKHNFSVEDGIWEEFKIYCIKNKTTATKVISDYVKKLVGKNGNEKRKIRRKKQVK